MKPRRPRRRALRAALLTLPLAAACASLEADRSAPAGTADVDALIERENRVKGEPYAFVWLLTGPRAAELGADEVAAATAGHFENMARLADEGLLLLAGPLPAPRIDPAHRGIFVFDVPTAEQGRELARTDPAVQAGAFAIRVASFRSKAPFRALLEAVREEQAAAVASGGELAMRPFVLVTSPHAEDAQAALAPLAEQGAVLFSGAFGGELAGTALFAIDARDVDEARELVRSVSATIDFPFEWAYAPWYGAKAVERMPALAAADRG